MIDLTPLDVRKKRGDFRRILRGYDPEEVDTFMDLIADRFEELVRANLHLSEKCESVESQLVSLVNREKAVQEALVSAQKLREELKAQSQQDAEAQKNQAKREANLLKAEAETEIQRRLVEAEGLLRERQRALDELERSRLKFLKSFRGLLERELDAVEVEESRRPLEERPLVLELRGWTPAAGVEVDAEEETVPPLVDSVGEGEPESAPDTVAAAEPTHRQEEAGSVEEAPVAFHTQLLGGGDPVGIEELAPTDEDDGNLLRTTDAEEGGRMDELAKELLAIDEMADSATGPEGLEVQGQDESEVSEDPKWLYSLLKREKDKEPGE